MSARRRDAMKKKTIRPAPREYVAPAPTRGEGAPKVTHRERGL